MLLHDKLKENDINASDQSQRMTFVGSLALMSSFFSCSQHILPVRTRMRQAAQSTADVNYPIFQSNRGQTEIKEILRWRPPSAWPNHNRIPFSCNLPLSTLKQTESPSTKTFRLFENNNRKKRKAAKKAAIPSGLNSPDFLSSVRHGNAQCAIFSSFHFPTDRIQQQLLARLSGDWCGMCHPSPLYEIIQTCVTITGNDQFNSLLLPPPPLPVWVVRPTPIVLANKRAQSRWTSTSH